MKLKQAIKLVIATAVFGVGPDRLIHPARTPVANDLLQFSSGGHILGFAKDSLYVASGSHALRVEFVGAKTTTPASASAPGAEKVGNRAAPLSRVTYGNLWEGVTLSYDAAESAIVRSTYRVEPRADPKQIRLRYNQPVSVERDGSLHVEFQSGAANESAPVAWQESAGQRQAIRIAFSAYGKNEIGFALGEYDRSQPLFIDPTLTWNTFLGGSTSDFGFGVAVDGSGNVYVTGESGATWGTPVRAFSSYDAFVAKLDANGALIWNTFLGGNAETDGRGVAVDGSGNVYIAGISHGPWGTPVRAYRGAVGEEDAFAAKLDTNGALIWNTFLGSSVFDSGRAVAVDGSGNVYVTGTSDGPWGTPVRAFSSEDAFVAKLDTNGTLIWNTFLGGSAIDFGSAVAADGSGNVYVAGASDATWGTPVRRFSGGRDAFAAKLDTNGALIWNTFLGGSGDVSGRGLAVDGSGNVYVAGYSSATWGTPVSAYSGGLDAFAAKLDTNGALIWNTFLGSSNVDFGFAVAVDGSGNVYVTGESDAMWGTPVHAFGGDGDAFAAQLNGNGALIWNTFLGGSGYDYSVAAAMDGSGNVYVAGSSDRTWGTPVRAFSGGDDDAFVAKLSASISPATLANVSTRLPVQTGDNALFAGFIVTGTQPKKVAVIGLGPSLSQFFAGALADPVLELHDSSGTLLESNDNWVDSPNKQAIMDSGVAPSNNLESAIIRTLPANSSGYTAILRGTNNGIGIGVVEAFDLDRTVDSKLANISTRGLVQTGDNLLIAGTIILGQASQRVLICALGPSLPLAGKLADPFLELHDGNGAIIETNDNWLDSPNKQAIMDSGVAPPNDKESAIIRTLPSNGAQYTAIVRGGNNTTGIAVIEVFALN
jgi:hypothetical protein